MSSEMPKRDIGTAAILAGSQEESLPSDPVRLPRVGSLPPEALSPAV